MINLKIIYSVLWVVICSLLCISFGQDIGIAQTPSQMAFDVGLLPKLPGMQTPSQQAFELRGNQTIAVIGTPTQQTFELRDSQSTLDTETPTQQTFALRSNQTVAPVGTPSQQTFELRGSQSTLGTETPSQQAFVLRSVEPTRGTEISAQAPQADENPLVSSNVAISEVVKEANALNVMVANNMTMPANLTSWKLLLNNGTSTYEFPDYILQPNGIVTIHTQAGMDTPTDLFGSNFMGNGTQDVELLNEKGYLVSKYNLVTP